MVNKTFLHMRVKQPHILQVFAQPAFRSCSLVTSRRLWMQR
jgi:hypothetical protein